VAIFTVILENGIEDRARHGAGPSGAFAHTYLWVVVAGLIALAPALLLHREEARARRSGEAAEQPPAPLAA
jgi:hypothetical protein